MAIRGQKSPLGRRIENDTSSCSVPTSDSTQPNHGVQASGLDDRAHLAKVETILFSMNIHCSFHFCNIYIL